MAADKMAIYSELESRVDNICNDKGCTSCDGLCLMKYCEGIYKYLQRTAEA